MSPTQYTPVFVLALVLISSVSAVTNLEVKTALDSFNAKLDFQATQLATYRQEFAAQRDQLEDAELKLSELQAALLLNSQMTCDPDSFCPKKNVTEPIATTTEVAPTVPALPVDCCDIIAAGKYSGRYTIYPGGVAMQVYCMHKVSDPSRGGGWSGLIMSDRQDYTPSTSYNQDYATYKTGFGRAGAGSNSFVGLDNIAAFLNSSPQDLLIEYTEVFDEGDQHDYNVEHEYYDFVNIDSKDGYRLNLGKGQYWNDAARATTVKGSTNGLRFEANRGAQFFTRDRDTPNKCVARHNNIGWWYNQNACDSTGITSLAWMGPHRRVQFMVRRQGGCPARPRN